MAATAVVKTALSNNVAGATLAFYTVSASGSTTATNAGALVTFDKADQKILLLLKNNITNATNTAVVRAGNGLQGVSNYEVTLAGSEIKPLTIESGKFKNVSGANAGKVLIQDKVTTTTTIEVAAVVLA